MMKKLLTVLGILVGLVFLVILGGYLYINARGIPSYEPGQVEYTATITPEAVERGEKLATMLCAGCHMNHETRKLTGQHMLDAPEAFGTIYSKNITQDTEYGIGTWTDAELYYLLRTGVGRDGQYIPPYMAKLTNMADEDVNAIIAFLRSDHPLVAADPTPDQDSKPGFLTKFLSHVAWKPMPLPEKQIPMPDTANLLELGRYLAVNLECFSCHSASFKTNDFLLPENSKGYFGGGNKMLNLEGESILTSNLTPHESGIGNWSREQFIQTLRFGNVPGEVALRFPMMPYSVLTDYEAGAIYDYLMTLEPIDNLVERPKI